MDAIEYYRKLFRYDRWANGEVLEALRAASAGSDAHTAAASAEVLQEFLRRLAHILGAQWLWLSRLDVPAEATAVWPELTLDECARQSEALGSFWEGYLGGLDEGGLSQTISYKNTKGEPWQSRIDDVLTHVVMHSAYHRGQIALEMRAAGLNPAYTDFIQAVRAGKLRD
jgi:uncharacterized damage-inducible protein DinB